MNFKSVTTNILLLLEFISLAMLVAQRKELPIEEYLHGFYSLNRKIGGQAY